MFQVNNSYPSAKNTLNGNYDLIIMVGTKEQYTINKQNHHFEFWCINLAYKFLNAFNRFMSLEIFYEIKLCCILIQSVGTVVLVQMAMLISTPNEATNS